MTPDYILAENDNIVWDLRLSPGLHTITHSLPFCSLKKWSTLWNRSCVIQSIIEVEIRSVIARLDLAILEGLHNSGYPVQARVWLVFFSNKKVYREYDPIWIISSDHTDIGSWEISEYAVTLKFQDTHLWGRFGFDGWEAVMDGIPGFPDIPKLAGSTLSADYDYAMAA